MAKILGIDHGSVRIGIAVTDDTGSIAFGREAIQNNKNAISRIKQIISENDIHLVILGYPLNLKGEKTNQTIEVEKFEESLKKAFSLLPFSNIEIKRWDERFTSKLAAVSMQESGMKKSKRQLKGNTDIISAALMLQSFIDSSKNTIPGKF